MKICIISHLAIALFFTISLTSAGDPKSEFVEISEDFSASDRISLKEILDDIEAEMIWASIERSSGNQLEIKVYNFYSSDSKMAPEKDVLNLLGKKIKVLLQNKYDIQRIKFQFLEEGHLNSDYLLCTKGC